MDTETKIRAKLYEDGRGLLIMMRHSNSKKTSEVPKASRIEHSKFKMAGEPIAEVFLQLRGAATPLSIIATNERTAETVVSVDWGDSLGQTGQAQTNAP